MKTFKIFSFATILMAIATISFAQKTQTETIPVSGNCGMCKSKIEKAAKTAGVEDAKWDVDAKVLTVKYNSSTTNSAKIQQAVAAVGYDTRDVKATNEAYDKLHG
ncbi:MAG: heavy-metal-associated domain-containing protein, partial [Chitinophagaceae bacterium]